MTTLPIPKMALEARIAELKLSAFIKQSWKIVESEKLLQWNWHLDAICEYLEAVIFGEIRRLIITVPPRHTKSTATSVCAPAWSWIAHPEIQWLFTSHDSTLATEHSVKCRRIVESQWYLDRWGEQCYLADDQNQKTKYENTIGGHRIATSIGGSVTGKGGDIIVVDDPHNVDEADSASLASLTSARDWFDGTLSTRMNDPKKSAMIIIMQRIHQGDLAGHVLDGEEKYVHLNLPSICEKKTTVIMPRSKKHIVRNEGDLLWPERFGQAEIDIAKIRLGSWKFASQHQQRPSPRGGGLIKSEWWQWYDKLPDDIYSITTSWDTACKDKQQNDFSAGLTGCRNASGFYMMDCWHGKVKFPDLIAAAKAQYAKHNPEAVIIEDASSGISLIQCLQEQTTLPVLPIKVDRDKTARLNAVSPTVESGNVFLPRKAPWVDDFCDQIERFPRVIHDEYVDIFSQLLSYFLGFVKNPLAEPDITVL